MAKKGKNKGGRPKTEIDQHIFENLCGIQCTMAEMQSVFDCTADTIERWCKDTYKNENGEGMTFAEVFKIKRGKGLVSLRRNQWKMSETVPTMAIWLGKQYLGQTESVVKVDVKSLETAAKILNGVDSVIE